MQHFKVSVIIPVYNEEGNIQPLLQQLLSILQQYPAYEILFVDDGSRDQSLEVIKEAKTQNSNIHFISFSKNFGHQLALKAGIDHADGDCVISMDADLQHPPDLITRMIGKWQEGYDIVYTTRKEDPKLSFIKKTTSSFFYKLINFISDVKLEEGSADFRLMDRSVADTVKKFNEPHLFLRGLVSWMGYKQFAIPYSPDERLTGESKYSFKKMLLFAINGITSFSVKPLKLSVVLGFIISLLALLYGLYAAYIGLFTDKAITGWTSLAVSVLFIGGLQLMMIGILGIYLGQVFMQTKGRPSYIIKERSN